MWLDVVGELLQFRLEVVPLGFEVLVGQSEVFEVGGIDLLPLQFEEKLFLSVDVVEELL